MDMETAETMLDEALGLQKSVIKIRSAIGLIEKNPPLIKEFSKTIRGILELLEISARLKEKEACEWIDEHKKPSIDGDRKYDIDKSS